MWNWLTWSNIVNNLPIVLLFVAWGVLRALAGKRR